MKYNIVNIINGDLTDTKLKEMINLKLFRVIELLEFNFTNYI